MVSISAWFHSVQQSPKKDFLLNICHKGLDYIESLTDRVIPAIDETQSWNNHNKNEEDVELRKRTKILLNTLVNRSNIHGGLYLVVAKTKSLQLVEEIKQFRYKESSIAWFQNLTTSFKSVFVELPSYFSKGSLNLLNTCVIKQLKFLLQKCPSHLIESFSRFINSTLQFTGASEIKVFEGLILTLKTLCQQTSSEDNNKIENNKNENNNNSIKTSFGSSPPEEISASASSSTESSSGSATPIEE